MKHQDMELINKSRHTHSWGGPRNVYKNGGVERGCIQKSVKLYTVVE